MNNKGFTFTEHMFVIGIFLIIAFILIMVLNPKEQFRRAKRNVETYEYCKQFEDKTVGELPISCLKYFN